MFKNKHRDMVAVNNITRKFGLEFNGHVTLADLHKARKKKMSCAELENELNELANYLFEGKKTVGFHEFRQFPYVFHGDITKPNTLSSDQLAGLAKAYTSADVYFVRFIRLFLKCSEGPLYSFPSIVTK